VLKLNLLLIICCFLFASCQNDLANESFINLEDEYELSISQELSINGGHAAMNIKTIHELDCSNYSIPYYLNINNENIDVIISKVNLEGACIDSSSYINQTLDFKFHNDEKNITISLQDIVSNSGKVKITEDDINLDLETNDGIKISKAKINRVKKNMMWGYIQIGKQSSINKIKELLNLIDNGTYVKPGDYGLFYVSNSNDIKFYETETTPISTFVFYSISNLSDIESDIQSIKETDPTLVFNLTLFDGQTINVK